MDSPAYEAFYSELRYYEIPLPPSGITQCDYLDMFPSPPTELTSPSAYDRGDNFGDDIVPEEEKSWFYYLAEISYRRMMNRAMAVMARKRPMIIGTMARRQFAVYDLGKLNVLSQTRNQVGEPIWMLFQPPLSKMEELNVVLPKDLPMDMSKKGSKLDFSRQPRHQYQS